MITGCLKKIQAIKFVHTLVLKIHVSSLQDQIISIKVCQKNLSNPIQELKILHL